MLLVFRVFPLSFPPLVVMFCFLSFSSFFFSPTLIFWDWPPNLVPCSRPCYPPFSLFSIIFLSLSSKPVVFFLPPPSPAKVVLLPPTIPFIVLMNVLIYGSCFSDLPRDFFFFTLICFPCNSSPMCSRGFVSFFLFPSVCPGVVEPVILRHFFGTSSVSPFSTCLTPPGTSFSFRYLFSISASPGP